MSECEWFNEVSEILNEKGVIADLDNDGWFFFFENGATPRQAIAEMFS